jgi:hypothetical protein
MRALLGRLRAVAAALLLVLVAAVLAELIPGRVRFEAWIHRNETRLLVAHGAAIFTGFLFLIGSALSLLMDQGSSHGRGRVEGHDQFSFSELKRALLSGALVRVPLWRRRLSAILGGTLLSLGIFGVVIVLAPMPVKLIAGAALAYALTRSVWAFLTAPVSPEA